MGVLSKAAWVFGIIFLLFGSLFLVGTLTMSYGDVVLRFVTGIFLMFIGGLLTYTAYLSENETEYSRENKSVSRQPVNTNPKIRDNNLRSKPIGQQMNK